ncbi:RNA-binding protein [Paenibacillus piri]|uniref:RNA-binding protein n=1 Tax=Paenibacillus piri TaxID=2547395 RepID=A0A4V2ZU53_9BACL|nr:RNA-binding protein [Paenibacillus piri]TDF99684.1 RNA-binding protein [Paenibacillus piri]
MSAEHAMDPALIDSGVQHWPDIRFVAYCQQTFGLNRGIYNTIDQWLYDFGYRDILSRRALTLAFLNDFKEKHGAEHRGPILRFGKGGLTKQLHDFIHLPKQLFLHA